MEQVVFTCGKRKSTLNTRNVQKSDCFMCQGGSLEIVYSFQYLGDQVNNEGICSETIATRIGIGWAKGQKATISVSNKRPLHQGERQYYTCVWIAMLHGSVRCNTREDCYDRVILRNADGCINKWRSLIVEGRCERFYWYWDTKRVVPTLLAVVVGKVVV